MGTQDHRYFQFGDFKLDPRRRCLFRNGTQIDVSAKNFDLLYTLIQNEGRVLTHDELLDTVWSGTFVEQSNLKKGISALRQVLDEPPGESIYIKTIPRQGYAFVAPVTAVPDERNERFRYDSSTEIFLEETEEIFDEQRGKIAGRTSPKVQYFYPVLAAIAIGTGLLGYWLYGRSGRDGFLFKEVRVEKLTTDGNCYGKLSPDNNFVVCTLPDGESGVAIEIQQLATSDRRRLLSFSNADIYASQFSPDGNFVYFVLNDREDPRKSGVYKASVMGGDPRLVIPNAASLSISPKGNLALTRAADNGGAEILVADASGEGLRTIATFPGNIRIWDFRFSADEATLLCSFRRQVSTSKNLFYVSEIALVDGSEKIVVPERDTLIASAAWMPDRASLMLCIREKNADIRQIWQFFPVSGEIRRITNDNISYRDIAVLKDGSAIAAVAETTQSNIWIADDETLDFRSATSGVQAIDKVFWTPDGRIGYAVIENGAEVVRLMSDTGNNRERLNDGNDGYWIQPLLAGDGRGITLISNRSGIQQLWRVDLDGKNLRQITQSETPVFNGRLSSDGTTAIYTTFSPKDGPLMIKQTADGRITRLNASDADISNISPDEGKVARFGGNDGRSVLILDLETGAILNSIKTLTPGRLEKLAWTRNGGEIAYSISHNGSSEIFVLNLNGGKAKKLTNFRYEKIFSFAWSHDGKKLAVVRGRTFTDAVVIRSGPGD